MKSCSISLVIWEMQFKTTVIHHQRHMLNESLWKDYIPYDFYRIFWRRQHCKDRELMNVCQGLGNGEESLTAKRYYEGFGGGDVRIVLYSAKGGDYRNLRILKTHRTVTKKKVNFTKYNFNVLTKNQYHMPSVI